MTTPAFTSHLDFSESQRCQLSACWVCRGEKWICQTRFSRQWLVWALHMKGSPRGTRWSGSGCPSRGISMCRATCTARWSPVTDEVAECKHARAAGWGENRGEKKNHRSTIHSYETYAITEKGREERQKGQKRDKSTKKGKKTEKESEIKNTISWGHIKHFQILNCPFAKHLSLL